MHTYATASVPGLAPGTLAPGALAPGTLASGALTPGALAPGTLAPGTLAPGALAPVHTGTQAQGDLLVVPVPAVPDGTAWTTVPDAGVPVVHGEDTGHTHWLHRGLDATAVRWAADPSGVRLGYVDVPPGETALLIHTDEHGANGIGPGRYAIHRKRAQEVRLNRPESALETYLIED